MYRFEEKIGAWLLKQGNTRELLAEKLGISVPTLKRRIEDPEEWTVGDVLKLTDVLDCDVSDLIIRN